MALSVLLPINVDFCAFRTLDCAVSMCRRGVGPARSVITFFTFVDFFPRLITNPVRETARLLPRFLESHDFSCTGTASKVQRVL